MTTTIDTTTVPPAAPATPPQVTLMGLPLDALTLDQAVEHVMGEWRRGRGGYVMTPNLDNLHALQRDEDLMQRARAAEMRVPDGMPLLWASRIQGRPLPGRVAGSDLIFSLAEAIGRSRGRLYLLGGEPGTAERAAAVLAQRSPGLQIAGTDCPPHGYERDPAELQRMRAKLRAAAPDFVYVGLPFPKASRLIPELRRDLPGAWFLGLGISFSFVCGDIQRAPRWMQRAGLEWAHRLLQEPRRLARRYLLEGGPFALRLFWRAFVESRTDRGMTA